MSTEKFYYTKEEIEAEVIPILTRMWKAGNSPKSMCEAFNRSNGTPDALTYFSSPLDYTVSFLYQNQIIHTFYVTSN